MLLWHALFSIRRLSSTSEITSHAIPILFSVLYTEVSHQHVAIAMPCSTPKVNDAFYDRARRQPNGKIIAVNDEVVRVLFHDILEQGEYDKDLVSGMWVEKFGGTYIWGDDSIEEEDIEA